MAVARGGASAGIAQTTGWRGSVGNAAPVGLCRAGGGAAATAGDVADLPLRAGGGVRKRAGAQVGLDCAYVPIGGDEAETAAHAVHGVGAGLDAGAVAQAGQSVRTTARPAATVGLGAALAGAARLGATADVGLAGVAAAAGFGRLARTTVQRPAAAIENAPAVLACRSTGRLGAAADAARAGIAAAAAVRFGAGPADLAASAALGVALIDHRNARRPVAAAVWTTLAITDAGAALAALPIAAGDARAALTDRRVAATGGGVDAGRSVARRAFVADLTAGPAVAARLIARAALAGLMVVAAAGWATRPVADADPADAALAAGAGGGAVAAVLVVALEIDALTIAGGQVARTCGALPIAAEAAAALGRIGARLALRLTGAAGLAIGAGGVKAAAAFAAGGRMVLAFAFARIPDVVGPRPGGRRLRAAFADRQAGRRFRPRVVLGRDSSQRDEGAGERATEHPAAGTGRRKRADEQIEATRIQCGPPGHIDAVSASAAPAASTPTMSTRMLP